MDEFAIRTLIVDDNEASAKTMGWTVELLDSQAELAFSGLQALEKALEWQPDAVLLDITLPDMDGYEVCRRMRAEPKLEGITIIAQTGWGNDEHRMQSKEAGFDHHLVKPVDMEALKNIFEDVKRKKLRIKTTG